MKYLLLLMMFSSCVSKELQRDRMLYPGKHPKVGCYYEKWSDYSNHKLSRYRK